MLYCYNSKKYYFIIDFKLSIIILIILYFNNILQVNDLDISKVLTITPTLAPPWKNLNKTNTTYLKYNIHATNTKQQ